MSIKYPMTVPEPKFKRGDLVNYNGTNYTIQCSIWCLGSREHKYVVTFECDGDNYVAAFTLRERDIMPVPLTTVLMDIVL